MPRKERQRGDFLNMCGTCQKDAKDIYLEIKNENNTKTIAIMLVYSCLFFRLWHSASSGTISCIFLSRGK